MSVPIHTIAEWFGPPVAVPADGECVEADLRQRWSTQTHVHARMYALRRVHLDYGGNLVVSTIRDDGPTPDFDIGWRFTLPLLDLFGGGGTEDPRTSSMPIDGASYPAMRYRLKVHFDARLDGCTAHIPDQVRTVVVIAPPERLDGIHLEWL